VLGCEVFAIAYLMHKHRPNVEVLLTTTLFTTKQA